MSDYFAVRIVDGRHQVGITTDGRDFVPLPRASFGTPREAVRYADMRQARISPLRAPDESEGSPFSPTHRASSPATPPVSGPG